MVPWWLRLWLQRMTASLPFATAIWKRYLRHKHLSEIDEETVQSALHQIELARANALPIKEKCILEIGSGWKPVIPLVFRMACADKIVMSDVSKTMDLKMLHAAIRQVREKSYAAGPILQDIGLSIEKIPLGYPNDFHSALKTLNLEYYLGELENLCVDAIISHNVLEHVQEEELSNLLKRCYQILKPGGWMIHFIDHSDHLQHRNPEISPMHFLRYEDETWKRWSKGPFHQNRLRWFEFREIFQQSGFVILTWEKECFQGVIDEAGKIPLCQRYQTTLLEDIAVLKSRVVLVKPARKSLNST